MRRRRLNRRAYRRLVGHDQRQIDVRERLIQLRRSLPGIAPEVRGIQLEHPTALVLRPGEPFDLHLLDLLRVELHFFLDLKAVGFRGGVRAGVEADGVLGVVDDRRTRRGPGFARQLGQ